MRRWFVGDDSILNLALNRLTSSPLRSFCCWICWNWMWTLTFGLVDICFYFFYFLLLLECSWNVFLFAFLLLTRSLCFIYFDLRYFILITRNLTQNKHEKRWNSTQLMWNLSNRSMLMLNIQCVRCEFQIDKKNNNNKNP